MPNFILGIDVGIRNLGLCALDLRTGRVAHWERVPLLPDTHRIHTGQLPAYVQRFLVAHASLFEQAEKIVIEHQLRGLMKTLEQMLHLKFYERVLLELLRAVYGEMVRANRRSGRWGQFDVKNLVLCVCVRITYSPQMANIKEAHVAEAMGFERPEHTTFRRTRGSFMVYLQTPIGPPPSAAMEMGGEHALTALQGPSSWEPPQQPLSQEPPQQQTPPHEPPQQPLEPPEPPQMWTMDEVLACVLQMEGRGELGQLTEEIPWEQFASFVAMLEREVV